MRSVLFTFASFLLAASASAQLAAPVGGWRQGDAGAPYTQRVHYPASTPGLDDDTPVSARIRGRIQAGRKAPATLIVNGNAMPLRLDERGAFARPYSFGPGSNGVEVRAGDERLRAQFYELAAGQPAARLRIVLSWDSDGTDLDLHVVTPSGRHAWYGERVIPGGAIDIDVTTGYGPEIFASPAPEKGLYQIFVNYFGGPGDADENAPPRRRDLTTARLTVVTAEGTADEKRREFIAPMRFPGELTRVCQFVHP
ncbi:MAG: DUF2135 domain-containing protein [Candidatus Accumulibacter sp.]|jgi:uncharacterized protein YfaP (DUF2135 family)|nr:DUF2135 domain-containing protein [Accumulibacter sp.]